MREELEEFCVLINDPTSLLGAVYANDPEMQRQAQRFLCQEGLEPTLCDEARTIN